VSRLRVKLELELSTLCPQSAEDVDKSMTYVDNVRVISVTHVSGRFDGLEHEGRLGASAPPAALGELRDPSLTETDLIHGYGGLGDGW